MLVLPRRLVEYRATPVVEPTRCAWPAVFTAERSPRRRTPRRRCRTRHQPARPARLFTRAPLRRRRAPRPAAPPPHRCSATARRAGRQRGLEAARLRRACRAGPSRRGQYVAARPAGAPAKASLMKRLRSEDAAMPRLRGEWQQGELRRADERRAPNGPARASGPLIEAAPGGRTHRRRAFDERDEDRDDPRGRRTSWPQVLRTCNGRRRSVGSVWASAGHQSAAPARREHRNTQRHDLRSVHRQSPATWGRCRAPDNRDISGGGSVALNRPRRRSGSDRLITVAGSTEACKRARPSTACPAPADHRRDHVQTIGQRAA